MITVSVYCVEPEGKDLQHSFDSNKRSWDPNAGPVKTIADGIRVLRIGKKCFPPISEKCEKRVLTVVSFFTIEFCKEQYQYSSLLSIIS